MTIPLPSSSAELQQWILTKLDASDCIQDTAKQVELNGFDSVAIRGVLSSLASREIVQFSPIEVEKWVLTQEGKNLALKGSHEAVFFNAVPAGPEGIALDEIKVRLTQGYSKRRNWWVNLFLLDKEKLLKTSGSKRMVLMLFALYVFLKI
jgi:hypothetical protein